MTLSSVSGQLVAVTVEDPNAFSLLRGLISRGFLLVTGILCCWLFFGWRTSQHLWTWFFFGVAVYLTVMAGALWAASLDSGLFTWLPFAGGLVLFMLLIGAVSADLQMPHPLPWTHWLGVVAYLVSLAARVVESMWYNSAA
jgi:hypothetical protein